MKKIVRKYTMPDEAMLVKAGVVSGLFLDDVALFTPKFPFLTLAFQTAFNQMIDVAEALRLDSEVILGTQVMTSDLKTKVLEGFGELRMLNVYAKLAYQNSANKKNVFGQSTWTEAKKNEDKMRAALEIANKKAKEEPYHTDILAKGYTDVQIDNLLIIADQILSFNLEQESDKSDRPVTTEERIEHYNQVWEQLRLLNICSKLVFRNNPAKLRQYMLYGDRVRD